MKFLRKSALVALPAIVAVVGLISGGATHAVAAPAVTQNAVISSVTKVERLGDPGHVNLTVSYSCPPDSSGSGDYPRFDVLVRQWTRGQFHRAVPAVRYSISSYVYDPPCNNTVQSTVLVAYPEEDTMPALRAGTADVKVTLVNPSYSGSTSTTYRNAAQKVTVRTPCCAPQIAWVHRKHLAPSTDDNGNYFGPDTTATLRVKYRCWPTTGYPDNQPYMQISLDQGTAHYYADYSDGDLPYQLPEPNCNGHWQRPTLRVAQGLSGPSTQMHVGPAQVKIGLQIAPRDGYPSGDVVFTRTVTVKAALS